MADERPDEELAGTEPYEEPGESQSSPPTGWLGRLSKTFVKPSGPAVVKAEVVDERPLSAEEKRQLVLRLDPTERKIGYIGAALAGVLALLTYLPQILHPTPVNLKKTGTCDPLSKGGAVCHTYPAQHWYLPLALYLILAVAMFVATRFGRRAPLAFAALMNGLAIEVNAGLIALPFIGAGGWILIRAWRAQRYGSPTAKGPNAAAKAGASAPSTTRAPVKAKTRGKQPASSSTGDRPKPAPSKRYTPKAPPTRAQKAAKAAAKEPGKPTT